MVDYGVPDAPESLDSQRGAPVHMEPLALGALLECPLCFAQLDASAKVLPCQHTFCTRCLQREEAAGPPLLCPECRAAVPVRTVGELPANLLLVQILEGLQRFTGPGGGGGGGGGGRHAAPLPVPVAAGGSSVRESQHRDKQGHDELVPAEPGPRGDDRRRQRNAGDGAQEPALCRALYDFNTGEINVEDGKYFLRFFKGDVLTVIRKLDEHWIEAKLGDAVGICPQQFTEPNSAAAKLLEGKSRRASDSTEFQRRSRSGGKDKAADAPGGSRTAHYGVPQVPAKAAIINYLPLSSQGKQSAAGAGKSCPTLGAINSLNRQGRPRRLSVTSGVRESSQNPQRSRRSTYSAQRHLLQREKRMTGEPPPAIAMALVNPQMSSASEELRNASTQQLSISVCGVLYSYKPRRPEELELRRGEMVGVYGQFKDGWLRGLSLRTGKVGILPSNYITPVLKTSGRLLETKAANASSQHNSAAVRKPAAARNPAVVLALDRVNTDGTTFPTGQGPSVPNGAQHAMSSAATGRSAFYRGAQGWDTVRRIFNPQKSSNHFAHTSNLNIPSNSQHFAQVQVSGYSPAMQRKKKSSIMFNSGRTLGWMTEPAAPSAGAVTKDHDFTASRETFPANGPQSILVRPDPYKSNADKPVKTVRFLTEEDSPPPRLRTSSWSSGSQVSSNSRPGPLPLEVWAPSLTLGRDGPGIILKEGKAPVLRKGLEAAVSDLNSNLPKPLVSSQPSLSAVSAQFSPVRHRVGTTHLAQTDSELSLLQGELVLVHRPRPDGRILVTQEISGQTGLFHSSVLQALERLS
ncbi:E3 ubiquitin-protein ligase SH3RF2 isoform X2 [Betta splendens]|nr:E3 ubiquitin-protein ligase SH3RF2 isoform X2 [Betta splendens]